jgi:putative transcriptional regulator
VISIPSADPAHPPRHHPPDELLLDLATGGASESEALILETHLRYCANCRSQSRMLDRLGGALLDALEPVTLPPNMLNRALQAIERAGDLQLPPQPATPRDLLEANLAHVGWRRLPGGFRMRRVTHGLQSSPPDGGRVWLFDAPAGMKLFQHRHVGDEWTLILAGELLDGAESYRAGDFVHLPDAYCHQPVAGAGDRCVSLILVRESPRFTTPLGKLMAPFLRL